MDSYWIYLIWAVLLVIANAASWATNLLTLPGNWLIVGFTTFFAWMIGNEDGRGIGWWTVGVILGLAVLGEIVELITGAAGAAKLGGSRRSMVLSVAGALVGSLAGAIVGLPVPLLGPAIAAVFGGAVGAFGGAVLGESWKGRNMEESVEIGRGAFLGRLAGTVGKLAVGTVMVAIVTVDVFI